MGNARSSGDVGKSLLREDYYKHLKREVRKQQRARRGDLHNTLFGCLGRTESLLDFDCVSENFIERIDFAKRVR